MPGFDEVVDWPAEQAGLWTDVDAAFLHAERRNMYDAVFGPDRPAGWDEDDEYREAGR